MLASLVKQRRDSIAQYEVAKREDLAEQERYEIGVCQEYLPNALSEDEISALIDAAVAASGAASMKEMGKVKALLKPQVQGRADIGIISAQVKQRLSP